MKFIPLLAFALLLFAENTFAQPVPPPLPRGRSLTLEAARQYPDSADFAKQFNDIYRIIHPGDSLRPQVIKSLLTNWTRQKEHKIDSAQFFQSALEKIEPDYERRIYFNAYRKAFTAQELKELKALFSSTIGKKLLAALPTIGDVEDKIASYGRKIVADASRALRPPRPGPVGMPGDSLRRLPPNRIRTDTTQPR